MIAAVLPDSLSISDRRYKFFRVHSELAPGVLVVRQGKKAKDVYAVQELPEPAAGYREFLLLRVSGKARPEFGPYCVSVPTGENPPECTCTGFGRWKGCKHIDCLSDLVSRSLPPL